MTFNLKFAGDDWPVRRPVMRELLSRERPELIGTQEGLYSQLTEIGSGLGASYDGIGLGRRGGSRDEFVMIFYDKTRLRPLEYDHFWLSDTPEVIGSKTWGGCCPRMVTWVRFVELSSGSRFYAVNTHFEAYDARARSRSADLLLERIAGFDPVILTGDFNEPPGGVVHSKLTASLVDTWIGSPSYGTFHGYGPLEPDGPRIDWILTSPSVRTTGARVNTFSIDGQFPSDHLPVQAEVMLP